MAIDPASFSSLLNFTPLNNAIGGYRKGMEDAADYKANQIAGARLAKGDFTGAQEAAAAGGMDVSTLLGLGNAAIERPLKQAQLTNTLLSQAAPMADAIVKEQDPARKSAMYRTLYQTSPSLIDNLPAEIRNDPHAGASFIAQAGQGTVLGLREKQSEIDLNKAKASSAYASAANEQYKVNPLTGEYYSGRTGSVLPGSASNGDQYGAIAAKAYAAKAPEYYEKAAKEYSDAGSMLSTLSDLKTLAPYASTGFGAEQVLMLRKAAAAVGISNSDRIAPTELFRALSQEGILTAAQKLKPLSNSDVAFVERGLVTIKSDPSSVPQIIAGFEAIAKRTQLAKQLEMEFIKRGRQPDYAGIAAEVDKVVPSPIAKQYGGTSTQQQQPSQPPQQPRAIPSGTYNWSPNGGIVPTEQQQGAVTPQIPPRTLSTWEPRQ